MSEYETAHVFSGDEGSDGPTVEEQYAALVEEGVIQEDDASNAQGGAEGDPSGNQNEIPEWVPEKFRSSEDPMKAMAEAYAELERKQSGEEDDYSDEDSEVEHEAAATEEERQAAEEATEKAGLNLADVQTEWDTEGSLSEETYDALDAAGYPREAVDVYIEGLLARNNVAQTAAYGVVGGEEAYEEMVEWAVENLSDEEALIYDEAVNSRDVARVKSAVKGLNAQWMAAVMQEASDEPEDEITPKASGSNASVYQSFDDYMADLNDPRYDTNETFRAQVMAKLDRSKIM